MAQARRSAVPAAHPDGTSQVASRREPRLIQTPADFGSTNRMLRFQARVALDRASWDQPLASRATRRPLKTARSPPTGIAVELPPNMCRAAWQLPEAGRRHPLAYAAGALPAAARAP